MFGSKKIEGNLTKRKQSGKVQGKKKYMKIKNRFKINKLILYIT